MSASNTQSGGDPTSTPTSNTTITTIDTIDRPGTSEISQSGFPESFHPSDRLFGPYPSRSAAAAAAAKILQSQSPGSPCSSIASSSTEGSPKSPNALNLPHPASIGTISLSGILIDKLQAISEAGFNKVEIYENDLVNFLGQLSEIRDLCHELGLEIGSMRTDECVEGAADPIMRNEEADVQVWRVRERLESKFTKMDQLGTNLLVVIPGSTANPSWAPEQAILDLQKAADLAERRGKRIALRHMSCAPNIDRWEVAWELIKTANRPNLGICLDTFYIFCHLAAPPTHAPVSAMTEHNAAIQRTLATLAALPKNKIFSIYLTDGPSFTSLSPWENVRHRVFPGHGDMKLKDFLKAVVANSSYDGSLVLESLNDDYRAAPPKKIVLDGRRCMLSLLSEVYDPYYPGNERQVSDSEDIELYDHDQVPPSQPSNADYVVLPPLGTIYGLDFIEFVVREAKVEAFGRWLERIGIKRVGKHPFKNVFVYRNGEVTIFLTFDPTLYSTRPVYLRNNIGVSIMGVRVSNISNIVARARLLNYPVLPISKEMAPGEQFIGVEAPDQRVILLLENDSWKKDIFFEGGEKIENDEAHYTFIDHFAQALDRPMLESFISFYKGLFGMHSQSLFELKDPYGSVKSRAMVSAPSTLPGDDPCPLRGGLRFPMNTFENKETYVGKLVYLAGGSVMHHIAFGTNDIFSLSETIRKKFPSKHTLLRVPPHYYDELQRKYADLSDEFIAMIKANDILYDRIDGGELLTLNTELFEELFFVEICERRNGYQHFGAANSELRSVSHYQYNLANENIKSIPEVAEYGDWRGKKRRKLQSSFPYLEGKGVPILVVVHSDGLLPEFDQTADVLGCEYIIIESWEQLQVVETRIINTTVVAIEKQKFLDHFLPHWESPGSPSSDASARTEIGGVKRVLINTVCAEKTDPEDQRVGDICDFEYYYPQGQGTRIQYTRFLSFVLQLKDPHPHDQIIARPRSAVLTLPFADVRHIVPSMDILTLGVDAVELRVDLLQEHGTGGGWRVPSIKYVGEQVMWLRQSTELPIVFTIRSILQGGKFPLDDIEIVQKLLKKALQWGCEYIDVEIRQIPNDFKSQLYSRRGMTRIISTYSSTEKFSWMSPDTVKLYYDGKRYGDAVRILGFADEMSDNHELETFRNTVTKSENSPVPLVAINMGEAGQLSRLLNTFMTPVTHPLIATLSAPGHITKAELHSALHIIGQFPKREIYCLSMETAPSIPISTASVTAVPLNFYDYTDAFNSPMASNMSLTAPIAPPNSTALFIEKCLKELSLPYRLTCLPLNLQNAENTVQLLLRSAYFGGAGFSIPLPIPTYVPNITSAARAIGSLDMIVEQPSGTHKPGTLLGDNVLWKSIQGVLLHEFTTEAYRGKPGLVLSMTEREAAAAVYALRSVGVSKIYTICFGKGAKLRGTGILGAPDGDVELEYLESPDALPKVVQPFVVISVLKVESARIVLPILERIAQICTEQGLSRRLAGRIYVEVISNFPGVIKDGNPTGVLAGAHSGGAWAGNTGTNAPGTSALQEARKHKWAFAYGGVDIQAKVVTEKLKLISGQHVSQGFMRMAAISGLY